MQTWTDTDDRKLAEYIRSEFLRVNIEEPWINATPPCREPLGWRPFLVGLGLLLAAAYTFDLLLKGAL